MLIDFKMSPSAFESNVQGIKPCLFKDAIQNHNIDWRLVNELISRHDHTSSNFKILKDGLVLKHDYLEEYQEVFTTKYRAIKPKLYDLMRSGASLALNKIENCPSTDLIRNVIANFTGRQTIASGYAAFGCESSFGNHWDTHDVFAVQLIGKKQWTIYAPTEVNPLYKNSSIGKEEQCAPNPFMTVVLEAGDIFYLPRGWWHEVTASGDETFHLAIGTYPPYVTDYLNWLVECISMKSELFRMSLDEHALEGELLKQIGASLHDSIVDPTNQQSFLQWFSGQQRVHAPYAIELFGNPRAAAIPWNSRVGINANNLRLWHGNEFVANGIKINLDDFSKHIFKKIAGIGLVRLQDLIESFPEELSQKVEKFVAEMIREDVFSIHGPEQCSTRYD